VAPDDSRGDLEFERSSPLSRLRRRARPASGANGQIFTSTAACKAMQRLGATWFRLGANIDGDGHALRQLDATLGD
jgi:hypothetical protein